MPNFNACVEVTLKWEGGYVNNPRDPGGATNMGITLATLRAYMRHPVTTNDVKAMPVAVAKAIYEDHYWAPISGDTLPHGIDLVMFDAAVNSGPVQAVKLAQKVLGLAVDGNFGPVTHEKFDDLEAGTPAAIEKFISNYTDARLAFLKRLNGWQYFGKGWQARCLGIEHIACTFAEPRYAGSPPLGLLGPNGGGPIEEITGMDTRSPRGKDADQSPAPLKDRLSFLAHGSVP